MTTNYARGRAFEYKVRDYFLDYPGVEYVCRAAGSHTPADLVVLCAFPMEDFNPGLSKVYLVQCKRDGKISKGEREKLLAVARATGAYAIIASQGKRGDPPQLEWL